MYVLSCVAALRIEGCLNSTLSKAPKGNGIGATGSKNPHAC